MTNIVDSMRNAAGPSGGLLGGNNSNGSVIELDPENIVSFTQEYEAVAEQWDNIAAQLITIYKDYQEDASMYVQSGDVAPALKDVLQILDNKLVNAQGAVTTFADTIRQDSTVLRALAIRMHEATQQSSAEMEAIQ